MCATNLISRSVGSHWSAVVVLYFVLTSVSVSHEGTLERRAIEHDSNDNRMLQAVTALFSCMKLLWNADSSLGDGIANLHAFDLAFVVVGGYILWRMFNREASRGTQVSPK